MKKFFIFIAVILIGVFAAAKLSGGSGGMENPTEFSVAEAAFSARNSETSDATGFLVGLFSGDNSTSLNFTGGGEVLFTDSHWNKTNGTCSLTQTGSGAAILRLSMDGATRLYTFHLLDESGQFSLTDADNNTVTYKPLQ